MRSVKESNVPPPSRKLCKLPSVNWVQHSAQHASAQTFKQHPANLPKKQIQRTRKWAQRSFIMNKFLRFFAPPVFEGNKEQTQSAKLLYQIIRLIWVLPILLLTIGILGGRAEVMPPAIVISILLLILMALSQIGWVGLASTFLVAMIILLIGYADFQNAGNIQPSTLMFAIAIIMSGLLLGRRAPLVVAILVTVSHGVIVS